MGLATWNRLRHNVLSKIMLLFNERAEYELYYSIFYWWFGILEQKYIRQTRRVDKIATQIFYDRSTSQNKSQLLYQTAALIQRLRFGWASWTAIEDLYLNGLWLDINPQYEIICYLNYVTNITSYIRLSFSIFNTTFYSREKWFVLHFLYQLGWMWRATKEGGGAGRWESNSQRRASETFWRMRKAYIWKQFYQGMFLLPFYIHDGYTFFQRCLSRSKLTILSFIIRNNCSKQEELERLCGPEIVANLEWVNKKNISTVWSLVGIAKIDWLLD